MPGTRTALRAFCDNLLLTGTSFNLDAGRRASFSWTECIRSTGLQPRCRPFRMRTMGSRRGRPPTGCPKWDPDTKQWNAWPLLPNGSRRPIPMPGIGEHETERAAALAKTIAYRVKDGGYVPSEALETVNDWFTRWAAARTPKGLSSVRTDRSRFVK